MSVIAVDIETIDVDPESETDLLDSRQVELLCVGLGYQPVGGQIETEVVFRRGLDPASERDLLRRVVEWIEERGPVEYLLSYNGSKFDMRHLHGRAEILSGAGEGVDLPAAVATQLSVSGHRDLLVEFYRRHNHRVSLEDALREYDIAVPERIEWEGERIENWRIPDLGRDYLLGRVGLDESVAAEELEAALRDYTEADIRPLFELAAEMRIADWHYERQKEAYTEQL